MFAQSTHRGILYLFALLCALLSGALAQADNDADSISQQPIPPDLILLQGRGGNMLLQQGDQGLLLIDNDYREMGDALERSLRELGGIERLHYVINTHWHSDHTGNNDQLGKHAAIVAHDNVRSRLSSAQRIDFFQKQFDAHPASGLPEITYQQTLTLHFNQQPVLIRHYPNGHTDGDSTVFFPAANVLHTGDLFFNGIFPFVDLQNGGNVLRYRDNVRAILTTIDDQTIVVPGHGALSNKRELQQFEAMLSGTINEVASAQRAGKSLSEIQQQGLNKTWRRWSKGFISQQQWIGFIAESLAAAEAN